MNRTQTVILSAIAILTIIFAVVYSQRQFPANQVQGNVIKVANGNNEIEIAAVYPVTVEGYWECLPHKNTQGPQTGECAIGIAVDQSDAHYALDLQALPNQPVSFPTGTRVLVEGTMVPASQLNSDIWQKYPIDGIISVTNVLRITE